MFHVYEQRDRTDELTILSDDDWNRMSVQERARYRLRISGFRTALEAVVSKLELLAPTSLFPSVVPSSAKGRGVDSAEPQNSDITRLS